MAKTYLWRNIETKEVRETTSWSTPPDKEGRWVRAYAVSFGTVPGAGGSPGGHVDTTRRRDA